MKKKQIAYAAVTALAAFSLIGGSAHAVPKRRHHAKPAKSTIPPSVAQATDFVVNPNWGETQAQFAARTAWWRNAKFGLFIHWGIYAVPDSDRTNTAKLGAWYLSYNKMQVADYAKYASQFDPKQFSAYDWVKLAKDAGMKYLVFTTKHHDGFCMFNTKLTDYNVVDDTPWHHDPAKDLAEQCRAQGIRFCAYYSYMDWHNPNYLPRRDWDTRPTAGASLDAYTAYVKGQLKELITQYGPLGLIWFDGGWEHSPDEDRSLDIVKSVRTLQPSIIINDRLARQEDYATPENTIPTNFDHNRLWETCMTINDHWEYVWNDTNYKSTHDLIQNLCTIVGSGGNFLLDIGPDANGVVPDPEVQRLHEIGAWMQVNGDSIYGTTHSPFPSLPYNGACTVKGDSLYLQVFDWPAGGLTLTGLKTPVQSADILATHQPLAVNRSADGTLTFARPAELDPNVTVVEVKLAGPVAIDQGAVGVHPDASGIYSLMPDDCQLHGGMVQVDHNGPKPDIGEWMSVSNYLAWPVAAPKSARQLYTVTLDYSCPTAQGGSSFVVTSGSGSGQTVKGAVMVTTDSWGDYRTMTLDQPLRLPAGGGYVRLVPTTMAHDAFLNLRGITLTPVAASGN